MVEIGIFIPIGNNGWLLSKNAPQFKPSYQLNKAIVQKAESLGFDFALSMIKLRGFGGATEYWDHNLESFTLMSGIAAVTEKIKLYATSAVLTLPPALAARMAATIDSIAPGRFGMNIVTGWQEAEYSQMGLWPGNAYFGYRYDYAAEYVQVMRDLWANGKSDFDGKHFHMQDCKLSPSPSQTPKIITAGQSPTGMAFASRHADYNFAMGVGVNTPTAYAPVNARLLAATKETGRHVGSFVLFMIIAAETDDAAHAKWQHYRDGVDTEAIAWMGGQGAKDANADAGATARTINLPEGAVNMNMGTLIGSYEAVAGMLDEVAGVEGTEGILLVFDEWLEGLERFGKYVQPLMKSRVGVTAAA
jgi:pyrimidine oxygenase